MESRQSDTNARFKVASSIAWFVSWFISFGFALGLLLASLRQPAGVIALSSALTAGLVVLPPLTWICKRR